MEPLSYDNKKVKQHAVGFENWSNSKGRLTSQKNYVICYLTQEKRYMFLIVWVKSSKTYQGGDNVLETLISDVWEILLRYL